MAKLNLMRALPLSSALLYGYYWITSIVSEVFSLKKARLPLGGFLCVTSLLVSVLQAASGRKR